MSVRLTVLIAIIFSLVFSVLTGYITWSMTDSAWQKDWDDHIIADSESLRKANDLNRKREQEMIFKLTKVEKNARDMENTYRNDLIAANDASERLRIKLQQFTSRKPSANSTSIEQLAAAATDRIVLAELLERARKRMAELGDYADRSRKAGLICEQSYQALYSSN